MNDSQPTSNVALSTYAISDAQRWFEYPIHVYPHHTDYGGVGWHGTYIAWMEEARVKCLRSIGIDYADLVAMGCELPVVEFSTRYHRAMKMGVTAIVKTRMSRSNNVRLDWDYQIVSEDGSELYLTGRVTLVPIDRAKGKIMRRLPQPIADVIDRLAS